MPCKLHNLPGTSPVGVSGGKGVDPGSISAPFDKPLRTTTAKDCIMSVDMLPFSVVNIIFFNVLIGEPLIRRKGLARLTINEIT